MPRDTRPVIARDEDQQIGAFVIPFDFLAGFRVDEVDPPGLPLALGVPVAHDAPDLGALVPRPPFRRAVLGDKHSGANTTLFFF